MPQDKLPLVLLSGLLCDERLWRHQYRELSTEREVFVPRLTGQSSIAAVADAVLADAPEFFALAGLSMGGYVAFEIMRRAPERVARLALVDTMASPDPEKRRLEREQMLELSGQGRFLGVTPSLLPRLIHRRHLDTEIADLIQDMAQVIGREHFLLQQRAIIDRNDFRPVLPAIDVETLVVVGEDDQLTPVHEAQLIHDNIPNASLVVLPQCGHLPPLEEPEPLTDLLKNWLGYVGGC